jgi:hypothetical protein
LASLSNNPKRQWDKVEYGEHRAITFAEHKRILAREENPERKAFYEICWHFGGSQRDMAELCAENINWEHGLSHFILALVNPLFKSPSFILIDEPENSLHPKMQETFIRALASKSRLGLVAASHSIGLARSAADRIYSLEREGEGLTLKPFGESHKPTVAQSLHELGYSQFLDIGGNNILLVEGRTDIKALREILRKFGIEQHFIFGHLVEASLLPART